MKTHTNFMIRAQHRQKGYLYMDQNQTETGTGSQKLEPTLRAAMSATPSELSESSDLATGISSLTGLWEVIVLYTGTRESLRDAFPALDITYLFGAYAIVRLPESELNELAASPLVTYVEKPKRLFFELLSGRRASCITAVQTYFAGTTGGLNLTGEGTLVAVIDSGIDYAHPDFRNEDGSSRILFLWDQTIAPDASKGFAPPEGYSLGTLFSREQIDAALNADTAAERERLCPSRDPSGHGTHVAGIAAGNGRAGGGAYRGVAYRAGLIIVKLGAPDPNGFPSTTQLMQAVNFCVETGIRLNRPLAVNLSFGNTYGSHSGSSLLETYLDFAANLGRTSIVCGSGNEGNSAGHAGGRLRQNTSEQVEFAVSDYERSLSIQLWKNYWDEIRVSVQAPFGGAPVSIPDAPGSWRFPLGSTQLLVYYGEPSPYSLYQEIYLELLARDTPGAYITPGIWSLNLTAQRVTDGLFDLWMPAAAIRGLGTQFLNPTPLITLTIPSTAAGVITVGAYDSAANTLAPFSGRGYTWNTNQIKPDLVAPGVDITSCAPGGGYDTRSGTSMATPFVTGSCALLMQWGILMGNDVYLYGEKLKAYLIRGTKRPAFSGSYPNPESGWGTLCVADSLPL